MKVLWICNIMLPAIAKHLGRSHSFTGGWLTGLSEDLSKVESIELIVLFPTKEKDVRGKVDGFSFYGFDKVDCNNLFYDILKEEKPDVIHVFGTEFKHSLDMVSSCEKLGLLDKVVINIQGLTSVIAKHYTSGLPNKIIYMYTFRDLIKNDNIYNQMKKLKKRGDFEIKALKKVKHVIGRTDWDRACTSQINEKLNYHFCNETLRSVFYKKLWNYDDCDKHSIFVSQASYPIKGFHFMLQAMPEILKKYPKTKLYVTGKSPFSRTGLSKLKVSSYEKYIGQLINKYKLNNSVFFLGALNELEMCKQYLKSNVFISCSSIENSSNSIGEAMLLGVPTVSSDVGGVKNLMTHNVDGYMYQYDASYMLAYYICKVFSEPVYSTLLSKKAVCRAKKTHDRTINTSCLRNIYRNIMATDL